MNLQIIRLQNNVWKHITDNGNTILSKASVKIQDNDFILSNINGQKPIKTFDVSEITLIDETTSITYPTFANGEDLAIQLKALGYVGFFNEGDVIIADLISSDTPQSIELGTDGKLSVQNVEFIQGTYVSATDINNGQTSLWAVSSNPINSDLSLDRWVSGGFVNQRLVHMFGVGVNLKRIEYVNLTFTLSGSNTVEGAKDVKVYAITAQNVFPSETYNVIDSNYTLIADTLFEEYTQSQSLIRPTLTLSNVPSVIYGLVYDIANNYSNSGRIQMRRLSPYGIYV